MKNCYQRLSAAVGLAVTLLSLHSTIAVAADEIQRNPFSRPPIDSSQETASAPSTRREEEWRPELRAVLVAGPKSVADLGGVILRIGEHTNGFRLLSVAEGSATFNRNGERVVISLYEQDLREQQ